MEERPCIELFCKGTWRGLFTQSAAELHRCTLLARRTNRLIPDGDSAARLGWHRVHADRFFVHPTRSSETRPMQLGWSTLVTFSLAYIFRAMLFVMGLAALIPAMPRSALAQLYQQQGNNKLVGTTTSTTPSFQGDAVALSADGRTAIVGGMYDNGDAGAAWVYTRVGNAWSQQSQLVDTSAAAKYSFQGSAVALSADGNTAVVGGTGFGGEFWTYTRSGVWTQQGSPVQSTIDGIHSYPNIGFGSALALSADGNTLIVGVPNCCGGLVYNSPVPGGAVFFIRSGGSWTFQGAVEPASVLQAFAGTSVGISADGNTAILGAPHEGTTDGINFIGEAYVYTSINGT